MSSTAAEKAASFARDGLVKPLIFRTNCSDAAWISSSVAGGSKLNNLPKFPPHALPPRLVPNHARAGVGLGRVTDPAACEACRPG